MLRFFFIFGFLLSSLHSALIQDKILICGICKNIEKTVFNSVLSATKLGEQFLDYQVIFYENNSKDTTKHLLRALGKNNSHFIILTEDLNLQALTDSCEMKVYNRTEAIARARNCVLDIAMQECFDDYKYIVWADLDFAAPWDVENLIDTILYPEQEWDAVLANGAYDLFALRDEQFPIGLELIGNHYWPHINEIRAHLTLNPADGWRRVYSAFGGLGIYKREAIKGCRYSGVVTKDLEKEVLSWLAAPTLTTETPLMNHYLHLLSTAPIIQIDTPLFHQRHLFPAETGVQLNNSYGEGKVTWFGCVPGCTLPYTCEHITFHASMAQRGHNKIFINPKLISQLN